MKIKLTLICLLSFPSLFAQPENKSWSLEQCIEYALENNIQLKQSELNLELAELNLLQSKASLLPGLNAGASHNYNFGQRIDPFTNQFATDRVLSQNFYFTSGITLFNGMQQYNTIKQNQFALGAGKFDLDKYKDDLSLNIASAYLTILFNKEASDIAERQLEISKLQEKQTQKLVDAGTLAKGNLLDVKAQLAAEELNLVNAQNQLSLAYLKLKQLLNWSSSEEFEIVDPFIELPQNATLNGTPGQIYDAALSRQPGIKSAELKVQSASKGIALSRGNLAPIISFNASIGTGYSGASKELVGIPSVTGYYWDGSTTTAGDSVLAPMYDTPLQTKAFTDQWSDNFNRTIGFNVTIPIFNKLQTKTAIERAKINFQNAEYTLASEKLQLDQIIQQAYADAQAALKRHQASKNSLAAMQEAFKYAQQRFDVGMMNAVEFNDSKNKLMKAESDLLQAKYDFVFKTKILDFYQGKALTF